MLDTGSKQPLLLQLLNEQRRFLDAISEMYVGRMTAELLREYQNEEIKRRADGGRALPLYKILVKRGALTEKEAADALRKARSSQDGFITAKDMEAFRKAQ